MAMVCGTTGIFGKWHLGDEEAYQPENRGFERVFIHGAGGTHQHWLYQVRDLPHSPTYALDLPGFGKSEAASVDQQTFLEQVIALLGIEKPVILAPSMSGRFAFPLLLHHPEAVGGFVLIAPAAASTYAAKLAGVKVPVLIIWGEADTIFPSATAEVLAKSFQNARVLIMAGARHACYLAQPEAFHQALLQFMKSILESN